MSEYLLKNLSYVKDNKEEYIRGAHLAHERWKGDIDDLRIYNRAITKAEVKALHAMGEASK